MRGWVGYKGVTVVDVCGDACRTSRQGQVRACWFLMHDLNVVEVYPPSMCARPDLSQTPPSPCERALIVDGHRLLW